MSAALDLYAKLTEATDEKERAHLIASAFDALEARFIQINEQATQGHVRENELRLQKEIKEVGARLQEQLKDIELQIKQFEVNLHQAMAAQTCWLLGGLAVLGAVFKIADLLIGP
ncbi:hypothetical protein [Halochromatium glycolicum]|jgi:hypothetical protein|uniref:DUF1640 domain-containing protein n=1 Tax=Halochromatium glycolicum TaxID=85075 RepID=A0AAJ0U6P9_9GAMM|nr:hypothetical protein [Halochromatium glycolicum]MBK1706271.1 hypothetical protein [Halochromatium glycolicum]